VEKDREQFLNAGMDDNVLKPIEPCSLLDVIQQSTPTHTTSTETGLVQMKTQHEPDWPLLLDRIGGDPELLQTIIELFHEEYPLSIASISDAIEQEDLQTLRLAAHKLKGALSTLDLGVASELAFQLQDAGSLADARTILPSLESEISRYVDLQKKYLES
jgi:HPt (histidine-containing phosphotransfer) domain-containing protein